MLKNLKSKMGVATQMAKEKMGKSDATMETESTRDLKLNLKTVTQGYTRVSQASKTYVSDNERLANASTELGNALVDLGSGILTNTPLGMGLHTVGNQMRTLSAISQQLSASTSNYLFVPINRLLEIDLKRANDIKHNQETARLKYDAAQSSLNKHRSDTAHPQKVVQLEAEVESHRQAYEQFTIELTQAINQVLAQIGSELTLELKNWAAEQARFYQEMSSMWSQVESQLAPIPTSAQVTTTTSVPGPGYSTYGTQAYGTQAYATQQQSYAVPASYASSGAPYVPPPVTVDAGLSKRFDNSVNLDGAPGQPQTTSYTYSSVQTQPPNV